MKIGNIWLAALALGMAVSLQAQEAGKGGISPEMLKQIKQSYKNTPADKALRNAISSNNISKLAVNSENAGDIDTYFSHKVNSKGITNQK